LKGLGVKSQPRANYPEV